MKPPATSPAQWTLTEQLTTPAMTAPSLRGADDYVTAGPGIRAAGDDTTNIALGKQATASSTWGTDTPSRAFDGILTTWWNAASWPPQWIEVDLGAEMEIRGARLLVQMSPNGFVVHTMTGRTAVGATVTLGSFSGQMAAQQWLAIPSSDVTPVRYVRITTTASPSWVAWFEIQIFAAQDNALPNTALRSGPAEGATLETSSVSFTWTGADDSTAVSALVYSYRLDGEPWSVFAPDTVATLPGLAEGAHRFEVKARDEQGNEDPSPAFRNFTIDLTPPNTIFVSGPAESTTVYGTPPAVTIAWTGTDSGSDSVGLLYSYRIDSQPFSAFCPDTLHTFSGLTSGWHTVEVKARDPIGHEDPTPLTLNFRAELGTPVSGAITSNTTWTVEGSPYVVTGDVTVQGAGAGQMALLTVRPGVEVRFAAGTQLVLGMAYWWGQLYGALDARGTADSAIVFTSAAGTKAPGDWKGLVFTDQTVDSLTVLEHCVVEYGGAGGGNVRVSSASPSLRENVIRRSSQQGVWIEGSSSPGLTGNTIESNNGSGVYVVGTSSPVVTANVIQGNAGSGVYVVDGGPSPLVSGNSLVGNTSYPISLHPNGAGGLGVNATSGNLAEVVEVRGVELTRNTVWPVMGLPYLVTGDVRVQGAGAGQVALLTVRPGVEVRFAAGTQLVLGMAYWWGQLYGALDARGTADSVIVFTSAVGTKAPGDWKGLVFTDQTVDSLTVLEHCVVEYGGLQTNANLSLDHAVPQRLGHLTLSHSSVYAVVGSNAPVAIHDCDIASNGIGGINNLTPASVIDATNNWWGDPSGPSGQGPGGGQSVSLGVNFIPWLTTPWQGDLAPPTVLLTASPREGEYVTSPDVLFSWRGSDDVTPEDSLHYAYRLDLPGFGSWTADTAVTLTVPEGVHQFQVKARDKAGRESTPAAVDFFYDLTPPHTWLVSGLADSGWVNTSPVTFVWSGTDNVSAADSLYFASQTDDSLATEFTRARTRTLELYPPQLHALKIWSKDLAGNIEQDTLVIRFRIDTLPPDTWFIAAPIDSAVIGADPIRFSWIGLDDQTVPGALQFAYRLDAGAFSPFACDSSRVFTGLSDGWHILEVKARDLARNEDSSPATRIFRIDRTPPAVLFTSGPEENQHQPAQHAEFVWDLTDNVTPRDHLLSAFSLDARDTTEFSLASQSASYDSLSEGLHSFRVLARDDAGNVGAAQRVFGVDFTAPTTRVIGGPADSSWVNSTSVTFDWTGTDNVSSPAELAYSHLLDGEPFSDWGPATDHQFSGMTEAPHMFVVRARDKAGNVDASPDTIRFTVGLNDLICAGITIPDSAFCSLPISVTWIGMNQGSGPALGSWSDGIYLSSDDQIGDDRFLQDFPWTGTVGPDSTYSGSGAPIVPPDVAPGFYWLVVKLDTNNALREEGGEDNNVLISQNPVWIAIPPHPDLQVAEVTHPADGWSGQGIEVTWTVQNLGTQTAVPPWTEYVYLSADSLLGSDQLISTFNYTYPLAAGRSYTHVHPTILPPDIEGDYWLIVCADGGTQVREYESEDNNCTVVASQISVHLTPFPDLQVTAAAATPSVQAGSTIDVQWTVSNAGSAATNAPIWKDAVYLSSDPQLGGDTFLGEFSNITYLNPEQGYNGSGRVTLPYDIGGTYYLIVLTDSDDQVEEHLREGNNFRIGNPITIELVHRPKATLEAGFIPPFPPTRAWSGQPITVSWRVTNVGDVNMSCPSWEDIIFVSTNTSVGQPPFWTFMVHQTIHQVALSPGQSDTLSFTGPLPTALPTGDYYLLVAGDIRLFCSEGSTTGTWPIHIDAAPSPDLEVTELGVGADSVVAGQDVTVRWTVTNQGPGPNGAPFWKDSVYLSSDDSLDVSHDTLLGEFSHFGYLDADQAYSVERSVQVPNGLLGRHWIFLRTDSGNLVNENDERNNCAVVPLYVNHPPSCNLRVTTVTSGASPRSGSPLDVSWTVENDGPYATTASAWKDRIYLSADTTLDPAADLLLSTVPHSGAIAVASTYQAAASATIPNGTQGARYLFMQTDADSQVYEPGLEDDNIIQTSIDVALTPPPDLQLMNLSVPSLLLAGRSSPIQWTVQNLGQGGTIESQWTDRFYLSADALLTVESDFLLRSVSHSGAMGVGAFYLGNENLEVPVGYSGAYYVIAVTDVGNAVYEHDRETNNMAWRAVAIAAPAPELPDLQVTQLSFGSSNDSRLLSWTVENRGEHSIPPGQRQWRDLFYLSPDEDLDVSADVFLGGFSRTGDLAPGAGYQRTEKLRLPNGTEGSFHLFALTDGDRGVAETGEDNNSRSVGIHVDLQPPDLQVTVVDGPDSASTGQSALVSWAVANLGTGPTDPGVWQDAVYLSRDQILDETDRLLASVQHSGMLAPGSSYARTIQVGLPPGLSGRFYFFVKADKNKEVYEAALEDNNMRYDNNACDVIIPLPADLLVSSVTTDSAGVAGDDIQIVWTVANHGANTASGTWTDAVFVSKDTTWSVADPLLGMLTYSRTLPPGASRTEIFRIAREALDNTLASCLPGIESGDYRIIVRTDVRNNIVESDEGNNEASSADPITVEWIRLGLGQPCTLPLRDDNPSYVELDSETQQDTRWRMRLFRAGSAADIHIRQGAPPTPVDYDISARLAGQSEQAILLPATAAGSLFAMIQPRGLESGVDSVVVIVDVLAPGVFSVSPAVFGNHGVVSLSLAGSGFSDGDRISLVSTTHTVSGEPLVALSSTLAQSAVSLGGEAPGAYDLLLETVSGDSLLLEDAVRLEEGGQPQLRVSVEGSTVFRVGSTSECFVRYWNEGNVDVEAGMILCLPGDNLRISTDVPYGWPWDAGETAYGDTVAFVVSNVPPGGSGRIPLHVSARVLGTHDLSVECWSYSPEESQGESCCGGQRTRLSRVQVAESCREITFTDRPACGAIAFQNNLEDIGHIGVVYYDENDTTPRVTELLKDGNTNKNNTLFEFHDRERRRGNPGSNKGYYEPKNPLSREECAELSKWAKDNAEAFRYVIPTFKCTEYAKHIYDHVLGREQDNAFQGWLSPFHCLTSPMQLYAQHNCGRSWAGTTFRNRVYRGGGNIVGAVGNLGPVCAVLGEPGAPFVLRRPLTAVGSLDPNEKLGPTAPDESPFISREEPIEFRIYFENRPSASAPAQSVAIADTLDADLDWRTFRLGTVAFGDTMIAIPQNSSYYYGNMDLPNGYALTLHAGLDIQTGIAQWSFQTTDPTTGLLPIDPMAGFLPPNDTTGVGEGYVVFTIRPDVDAPVGTEITNSALIVFDDNEPITTNEVRNVLRDALPDLEVTSATVESDEPVLIEGNALNVLGIVRNSGEVGVSGLSVVFYDGDPASGGCQVGAVDLPNGLSAGAERGISLTWIANRVLGDRAVYVVADPLNALTELAEANNTRVVSIPIAPRSYTLHLVNGINMMSLPLDPGSPYSARLFAEVLAATMIVRTDSTGLFESYIAEDPQSPDFLIEGGSGYVAVVTTAGAATLQGMSHLGTVRVSKGLSIVSVPLQPDSTGHARSLASALGAQMILRYDTGSQRFEPFIPEFHSGDGFEIQGGAGYLVVAERDTAVVFEGQGWMGEQPLSHLKVERSPGRENDERRHTPVLAISGTLLTEAYGKIIPFSAGARVELVDIAAGLRSPTSVNPENGHFSGALVGFENAKQVSAGDTLDVIMEDQRQGHVNPMVHYVVSKEDVERGYARLGNIMVHVPPMRSLVHQCFPNPFVGATTIRYQIATPGLVSLKVFDVAGRLVRTLVNEKQDPDYYEIEWQGDTDTGQGVASGVYFYKFEAPGVSSSRKTVIIR